MAEYTITDETIEAVGREIGGSPSLDVIRALLTAAPVETQDSAPVEAQDSTTAESQDAEATQEMATTTWSSPA